MLRSVPGFHPAESSPHVFAQPRYHELQHMRDPLRALLSDQTKRPSLERRTHIHTSLPSAQITLIRVPLQLRSALQQRSWSTRKHHRRARHGRTAWQSPSTSHPCLDADRSAPPRSTTTSISTCASLAHQSSEPTRVCSDRRRDTPIAMLKFDRRRRHVAEHANRHQGLCESVVSVARRDRLTVTIEVTVKLR